MDEAIRLQAREEFRGSIDKEFLDALEMSPLELAGTEVPSIRRGAQPGEKMRLLDTQMARDWQESVNKIIERGENDLVKTRTTELKPMLSTIQESFLLLQNNPDLIIGAAEFDRELAERFERAAKTYEVKSQGKVIGYGVNVQPLINEIRAGLSKERGVSSEKAQQQRVEAARAQAAGQARTPQGQFTNPAAPAPQVGVQGKQGAVTAGKDDEDYSTFWAGVGMPNGGLNNLRI
jgi:hypothetical protein